MFKISHLSLLNMCNEYKIYVEYGKKVKKVSLKCILFGDVAHISKLTNYWKSKLTLCCVAITRGNFVTVSPVARSSKLPFFNCLESSPQYVSTDQNL